MTDGGNFATCICERAKAGGIRQTLGGGSSGGGGLLASQAAARRKPMSEVWFKVAARFIRSDLESSYHR